MIAIDGPSASGKGTVAQLVAEKLGFHYLDSGALYRVLPWRPCGGIRWTTRPLWRNWRASWTYASSRREIWLDGEHVGDAIRTEECGNGASRIAAYPAVRAALLDLQRAFRKAPGLVADGRDMGSVVFPDATLKIFLTASAEVRADRRYKQLMEKGMHANITRFCMT